MQRRCGPDSLCHALCGVAIGCPDRAVHSEQTVRAYSILVNPQSATWTKKIRRKKQRQKRRIWRRISYLIWSENRTKWLAGPVGPDPVARTYLCHICTAAIETEPWFVWVAQTFNSREQILIRVNCYLIMLDLARSKLWYRKIGPYSITISFTSYYERRYYFL